MRFSLGHENGGLRREKKKGGQKRGGRIKKKTYIDFSEQTKVTMGKQKPSTT